MRTRIVLLFVMTAVPAAGQQPYLNLDFETATRGQVWVWTANAIPSYDYALDSTLYLSGSQSLRIRYTGVASKSIGGVRQDLPLDLVRGRHVQLAAYIKTAGITRGYAGFGMEVLGPSGAVLAIDQMQGVGPGGTTDWKQYAIEFDVSTEAVEVVIGALLAGDGTAWYDNVMLTIDGVPYVDSSAPNVGEPTQAELSWLQDAANPFASPEPSDDVSDLWPVGPIVGDAHIVGLGEGTHGTHEFFRMKHRLIQFLAQNKGFTLLAMEANMPEAEAMNHYLLTGDGDPVALLKELYFWTWNTREVLEMFQWIRQYNAAGNGPILFAGFDMQYTNVAIPNVETFLGQADPAYLPVATPAYAAAAALNKVYFNGGTPSAAVVPDVVAQVHAVWQHLVDNRAAYLADFPQRDVDWAIQNALIVEQATFNLTHPSMYRDSAMAANLEWIVQQNPGLSMILWAHDEHLWKSPGAMGSYTAANHGSDYVVFGSLLHGGSYNAVGALVGTTYGPLQAYGATPSFPGTVEYLLHSTGMPWCILDLRQASLTDPGSSWLLGPMQYRMIGSVQQDGFDFFTAPARVFDVLFFFDQSTPTKLLPFQ